MDLALLRCFAVLAHVVIAAMCGCVLPAACGQSPPDGVPAVYFATARVQSESASCSATVVAQLADGRSILTCASHCFGPRNRKAITVTYWATAEAAAASDRPEADRTAQDATRPTAKKSIGDYYPHGGPLDCSIIIARLDSPANVAGVGLGDCRSFGGRAVWAVGCPRGVWPPVFKPGRVTRCQQDSRGWVIFGNQSIIGGQSGGSLYDAATGYLIGITNWGEPTQALATQSWLPHLQKFLPPAPQQHDDAASTGPR